MLKENKVEIRDLANGMKVPTIGELYFCSRRDPLKEAQAWLQANRQILESSSEVIILGLGAGFHIQLLEERPRTTVVELRSELASAWQAFHPDFQIPVLANHGLTTAQVLEFRPAWTGLEAAYLTLSKRLRAVSVETLLDQAEQSDLWVLAESLKNSQRSIEVEITVKDISNLFPLENQTTEAKLWRALKEFVA
jgi:hypothetical protein